MMPNKKRKEVSLDQDTLVLLQIQAEKEGRKLKNYMEHILKEKANSFELTEEYKIMMDDMLNKHEKGKLHYISESEFRKLTARK
ncbi:hypothetical protein [Jejuia pallidilutea]|uniref:Toxin-antitoxin system, antitoxin component, ribbon-helix-helix domain protein n=1 Tax=Jejuia pallidilutea TaxID=504487 RepID=A0A090VZP0_9FLAO|nr:hypothetical protein [Jejuia pallidilutea]GAL68288.1 hypothetical protein JCM19301_228 [Jejuia pallidilutea]GAL70235.1 hypothetical protein JCM19302_2810 [Jejuia pallidilutea]GAL88820.1 hypothetical protein JCM19538_1809 [Jejuia pallidilutea]